VTSVYNLPGLMTCMMDYVLLAVKMIYQSSLNKKKFFLPPSFNNCIYYAVPKKVLGICMGIQIRKERMLFIGLRTVDDLCNFIFFHNSMDTV
jgi:hypothetical protein